jgi:hypothetical protein
MNFIIRFISKIHYIYAREQKLLYQNRRKIPQINPPVKCASCSNRSQKLKGIKRVLQVKLLKNLKKLSEEINYAYRTVTLLNSKNLHEIVHLSFLFLSLLGALVCWGRRRCWTAMDADWDVRAGWAPAVTRLWSDSYRRSYDGMFPLFAADVTGTTRWRISLSWYALWEGGTFCRFAP